MVDGNTESFRLDLFKKVQSVKFRGLYLQHIAEILYNMHNHVFICLYNHLKMRIGILLIE